MKTSTLLLFAIAFLFQVNTVQAQTKSAAVIYMEDITSDFDAVKDETWQYLKVITKGKGARKVESKRQNLISQLSTAKNTVSRKKGFGDDESLKNSVLEYFKISYIVLKEDFDKILDMEDISEQSYDAMEAYLLAKRLANEKLQEAFASFQSAQEKFCEENNITLLKAENDKQSMKMEKASNTLQYYNDLYLIFFKVYKQEAYVLDALARNDISSFDQNNKTLEKEAIAALGKLSTQDGYDGDKSLVIAAKDIMDFYKREATKDFQIVLDFYTKKDAFEKIQKNFEEIKKKDRTQKDIDQINKAGEEYNEAVEKYNKVLESSNKERSAYLNQWNKKVDSFISKHGS